MQFYLHEHPPLHNAEQANAIRHKVKGDICKTLFLTDSEGAFWLVTVPLDARTDLKALAGKLGCGRLTFGDEQAMWDLLGVKPGSVTPLAVVNDLENQVTLVLDEDLLSKDWLNVHPLKNTMSVDLTPHALMMLVEDYGHAPLLVNSICQAGQSG